MSPRITRRSKPAEKQPSRPVITRGQPWSDAVATADLMPLITSVERALTLPSSIEATMTPSLRLASTFTGTLGGSERQPGSFCSPPKRTQLHRARSAAQWRRVNG